MAKATPKPQGVKERFTAKATETNNHASRKRGFGVAAGSTGAMSVAMPVVGQAAAVAGLATAAVQYHGAKKLDTKAGRERNRGAALDYLAKRSKSNAKPDAPAKAAPASAKPEASAAGRTKPYVDKNGRNYANGRAISSKA